MFFTHQSRSLVRVFFFQAREKKKVRKNNGHIYVLHSHIFSFISYIIYRHRSLLVQIHFRYIYNIYKLKLMQWIKPFARMASDETSPQNGSSTTGTPVSSGERSTKRQCAGFTWTNGTGEELSSREHKLRHPQTHKFKGQYPLYRAYIGISHRGTLVGVHPTIPWYMNSFINCWFCGVCSSGMFGNFLENWMVVKAIEGAHMSSEQEWLYICSDFVYLYVLGEWMVPNLKCFGEKTPTRCTKKVK